MEALGLESGTVRVMSYDSTWPTLFVAEAERITRHLAEHNLRLALEHTGSTAVPGLAAKPILDMLAGYTDAGAREKYIVALEDCGYTYRGEQGIAGRDFFRRGAPRSHHIHLTQIGSRFWRDHLAFRDHLRANPEAAAAYQELKYRLALRHPRNREAYIEGKTAFVHAILAGVE